MLLAMLGARPAVADWVPDGVAQWGADGVPQWTAGGVALCTATGNQESPKIVADGVGGAMVAWQDDWSGGRDIYAQQVPLRTPTARLTRRLVTLE